jgi:RHS repeat-associated protein
MRRGATLHQPLAFPGQMAQDGNEAYYNVHRWYRSAWGRYTQGDPILIDEPLNPQEPDWYAYARDNPLRFKDRRGLTSYSGFSPEQKTAMENAVKKALDKLSSTCCAGEAGPALRELFGKAKFIFDPNTRDCGWVNGAGVFTKKVRIGKNAFNAIDCCALESALTHEVNHLRWKRSGDKESYKIEKEWFGCGTGKLE